LRSGWRNREKPWTKELLTLAILVVTLVIIYQIWPSIP
jgi:uncharacterized membrane protein